ncbi:MAG: CDP-diacylglycerol--serine O-phosphatidyltransferase [Proteobacteria bacterium]|nr:CDP-diacylglycerol--serine O-phosphatidyltransferase [Pseudomonadota bacterium]
MEEFDSSKTKAKKFSLVESRKFVRNKLEGKVFVIPALITIVGLFCGFLAITSAIAGKFEYAAQCIALSFIMDGLDGRVARNLNATSAFGKEFDSLSDVIAFGVAPAVLVYSWGFSNIADEFGVLVSFIFVVCGAIRLARFNIMTTEESKTHFVGLPIPGAAAAITSLVYLYPQQLHNDFIVGLIVAYMLLISGLMVCTLPFFSLKKIRFTRERQLTYLLFFAVLVAIAWKYNRLVIAVGCTAYALSGILRYIDKKKNIFGKKQTAPTAVNS